MSKCKNDAEYRFYWPGKDESVICEKHKLKLENVVRTIGLHLPIIRLSEADRAMGLKCQQEI